MFLTWLHATLHDSNFHCFYCEKYVWHLSQSSNYRPIALATIISKIFESVLLLKCEEYSFTSSNQFGY